MRVLLVTLSIVSLVAGRPDVSHLLSAQGGHSHAGYDSNAQPIQFSSGSSLRGPAGVLGGEFSSTGGSFGANRNVGGGALFGSNQIDVRGSNLNGPSTGSGFTVLGGGNGAGGGGGRIGSASGFSGSPSSSTGLGNSGTGSISFDTIAEPVVTRFNTGPVNGIASYDLTGGQRGSSGPTVRYSDAFTAEQYRAAQIQLYGNQEPIVSKHFYIHAAPEDEVEVSAPRPVAVGRPQKHYKVIFIKAPSQSSASANIIPVQAPQEEKTIVYVLVKKNEQGDEIIIPTAPPTVPEKPEVYYIKYKSAGEAAQVQDGIQAAINQLGSNSADLSKINTRYNAAPNFAGAGLADSTFVSNGGQGPQQIITSGPSALGQSQGGFLSSPQVRLGGQGGLSSDGGSSTYTITRESVASGPGSSYSSGSGVLGGGSHGSSTHGGSSHGGNSHGVGGLALSQEYLPPLTY